ncbi:Uncharacterized protein HZ326_5584 [Fusarium oxysporum f. sp. albedinis]|nr:Uncharacterized protein HZ326_5584 [Fusarium oxysporum f. sp. albedinis]
MLCNRKVRKGRFESCFPATDAPQMQMNLVIPNAENRVADSITISLWSVVRPSRRQRGLEKMHGKSKNTQTMMVFVRCSAILELTNPGKTPAPGDMPCAASTTVTRH